jgi:DNA-binding beta-propeller fold protein YncE
MWGLRVVIGITLAVLAAACGAAAPAPSTTSHAPAQAASSSKVSNPFTVIARYRASTLGLKNPRDLAIGRNGNVYITDATDRVTEISPAGKVLRRWGGRGRHPGQFTFITKDTRDSNDLAASITVGPNGDVYVSDSGNDRVEVFSPAGHFIRQFGSSLAGANGHFLLPYDLVVDAQGNVYVADDQQNVVEKYSPRGAFLWQIGSGAGSSDPDLGGEFHLASIDRHGLIVTTSDGREAIIYLDAQGHKVAVFRTTSHLPRGVGPCDVALDPQGDAFVQSCPGPYSTGQSASPPYQYALVFDRTHTFIGAWHHAPFERSPRFGPNGEAFAVGFLRGGACEVCASNVIFKLKVALH